MESVRTTLVWSLLALFMLAALPAIAGTYRNDFQVEQDFIAVNPKTTPGATTPWTQNAPWIVPMLRLRVLCADRDVRGLRDHR